MSDSPIEKTQNFLNPDWQHRFRSFDGFIKKPKIKSSQKPWTPSTLKWFSLFGIGFLAYFWAFILGATKLELWVGITVTVRVSTVMVASILFAENARAVNKGWSRIHRYVNALIFTTGTIAVGFAGWIGGTAMHRHVEPLVSKFISP